MGQTPEELFNSCLLLAYMLAGRKHVIVPPSVSIEELRGAAMEGLWTAARRYDPNNGSKFSTFCSYAIRGSMQDHLRSLGRTPRSSPEPTVYSLNAYREGNRPWDTQDLSPGPSEIFLAKEHIGLMLSALETIREPHRTILRRYYFEGVLMREIAVERGITEGRVSQLVSRGLVLMRDAMKFPRS